MRAKHAPDTPTVPGAGFACSRLPAGEDYFLVSAESESETVLGHYRNENPPVRREFLAIRGFAELTPKFAGHYNRLLVEVAINAKTDLPAPETKARASSRVPDANEYPKRTKRA